MRQDKKSANSKTKNKLAIKLCDHIPECPSCQQAVDTSMESEPILEVDFNERKYRCEGCHTLFKVIAITQYFTTEVADG